MKSIRLEIIHILLLVTVMVFKKLFIYVKRLFIWGNLKK